MRITSNKFINHGTGLFIGNVAEVTFIKYRPDIDGLRALAVLSVILFHAFPSFFDGGFVGVDVFFVISGFLISQIIFERLDVGTFSFSDFYLRRVKRIFPALLVVIFLCLIFGYFLLLADEFSQLGLHVAGGVGFISNFILWSESGYFDVSAEKKPLLHLWSLGIEEQFYIFWPLFLWLWWKLKARASLLLVGVAMTCLLSFSINLWAVNLYPKANFYFPVTRAWELLAGALLAYYFFKKDVLCRSGVFFRVWSLIRVADIPWVNISRQMLCHIGSVLGLLLLILSFFVVDKGSGFPGYQALLPVLGSVFLLAAGPGAVVNSRILATKGMVWIGLISYPLYLWHWPLLSFGNIIYLDGTGQLFRLVAIFLSFVFAWLTYRFLEQPIRFRIKQGSHSLIFIAAASIALGVLGLIVNFADFSKSHTAARLVIQRTGVHAIGSSLAWFEGKDNWLFLGDAYDNTVAKMKLALNPSREHIDAVEESFSKTASAAQAGGAEVALIIGPDKHSIYPEFLPDNLLPSSERYLNFFLGRLSRIPNLRVYDPTEDLLSAKANQRLLYWTTDTHWNSLGAFVAYTGLLNRLGIPSPNVGFKLAPPRVGDLVKISKQNDWPLGANDNWVAVWDPVHAYTESAVESGEETSFGTLSVTKNPGSISSKRVWVVGDSFTTALKPFISATFSEVHYLGHWSTVIDGLSDRYKAAKEKPDLILVIRVERSF